MNALAVHPAIEAERERALRAQYATLTAHYGKIGLPAVQAALLHVQNRKKHDLREKIA